MFQGSIFRSMRAILGVACLPFFTHLADAESAPLGGKIRDYYITAEEVDWNFAPAGRDEVMNMPLNEEQEIFTKRTRSRIGSIYHMARYFLYKDAAWKDRDNSADPANGILGPILHAEVGDRIVVHFLNRTHVPVSVHPHGVFYKKDSEGSMTNDGTSAADMADDHVPPEKDHTYVWDVPERAGPAAGDASSILWLYHSHVDEIGDTNTGLFGAMVIARKGSADENGKPSDVDREEFSFFGILDQNKNLFLPQMMKHLRHMPHEGDEAEEFEESNLKHSINGYIYGSQPVPQMKVGERVRWYVFSLGTETDLHTPHWHGNTVIVRGHREDVVELLPATTVVADMQPDNPGIWMYHCHVNDHIAAGMMTRYQVLPK